ncbi:MAG: ArsR/SmtB family transcription factor [Gemmobacter sp.]
MSTATPQARALAALGHDARLAIFRLLVRAGQDGLRVGEIASHLGLAPSTLAHHMTVLVDAGLVSQERRGREVVNRAVFDAARDLAAFLLDACCAGVEPRDGEAA